MGMRSVAGDPASAHLRLSLEMFNGQIGEVLQLGNISLKCGDEYRTEVTQDYVHVTNHVNGHDRQTLSRRYTAACFISTR